MKVKYLNADGSVQDKEVMMGGKEPPSGGDRHLGTWLHRHTFNSAIYEHIQKHHSERIKAGLSVPQHCCVVFLLATCQLMV
jgi:hypothetical protein